MGRLMDIVTFKWVQRDLEIEKHYVIEIWPIDFEHPELAQNWFQAHYVCSEEDVTHCLHSLS
jgi:hypothetical protein